MENLTGPHVAKLAKRLRLSQSHIARVTGVSRIAVNRFFRGRSEISASKLIKVLQVLGIDLTAQIMVRVNAPPPAPRE